MPELGPKARAQLPDSAFAYIDSSGRRRLPINDEAHVRNALARFNQVRFEDEATRDRARTRLLRAAKKYGIVPLGFMTGQLRSQSRQAAAGKAVIELGGLGTPEQLEIQARAGEVRTLPTGTVTFLFTDIEDSTGLVGRLGDGYARFLADVRRLLRATINEHGGREVDTQADEMFAVFEQARSGLDAALTIQRKVRARAWPQGIAVRIRIGLHTGRPTLTDSGYLGLAVHTAARISFASHGGQILLSGAVREAVSGNEPTGVTFRDLGRHQFHGLPAPESLFQVEAPDLPTSFPPARTYA